MSKTASLVYPFNTTTLDTSVWSPFTGAGASLFYTTSGVQVVFPSSSTSSTDGDIGTINTYDLTNSYVLLEIISVLSGSAADSTLSINLNANNKLIFQVENGTLYAGILNAGSRTNPWSASFDSINHKWWRIREASGYVYWETSADGNTWTTRYHVADPFSLTAISIDIAGTSYGVVANAGTFQFANLNNPPVLSNPVTYFFDGFEAGNDSAWAYNSIDTGNSISFSASYADFGNYGARYAVVSGQRSAYDAFTLAYAVPKLSSRFYFYIEQGMSIPTGDQWMIAALEGSLTDAGHQFGDCVQVQIYPPDVNGNFPIHLIYVNSSGTYVDLGAFGTVTVNTWHYFEITADIGSGTIKSWLDGQQYANQSSLLFNQTDFFYFRFGSFFSTSGVVGAIRGDNIQLSNHYNGPTITPLPINTNGIVAPSLIFASGFETGDISEWATSQYHQGNTLDVTQQSSLFGAFGLDVNLAGEGSGIAFLTENLSTSYPQLNIRWYMELQSNFTMPVGGDYYNILNIKSATQNSGNAYGDIMNISLGPNSSGIFTFGFTYINKSFSYIYTAVPVLVYAGVRHCVEMHLSLLNDEVTVWVDGTQVFSASNLPFGNTSIGQVNFGSAYSSNDVSGDVFYDNFIIAQQYIGVDFTPPTPKYVNTPANLNSLQYYIQIDTLDTNFKLVSNPDVNLQDYILSGSVTAQNSGTRRKVSLQVLSDIPTRWRLYRYKIYYVFVDMYGNETAYPLGVFIPQNPSVQDDGTGFQLTYDMFDQSQILKLKKLPQPLVFASGSSLLAAFNTIMSACGITLLNATDPGFTFGQAYAFDAGKTYQEVLDTLVGAFTADWYFDSNGYATLVPLLDPSSAPIVYDFERNLASVMMDKTRSIDQSKYYNSVTVVGGSISYPYYYYNTNAAEIQANGGVEVNYYEKNNALTDTTQTNAYGDRLLSYGPRFGETVQIDTYPLPSVDVYDVIKVDGIRYQVTGFTLDFDLKPMQINARRGILLSQ